MSDNSGWTCPKCGRALRLPADAAPPISCPLCAIDAARGPNLVRRAWNLVGALSAFVADGCRTISQADYQARLQVCEGCDRRQDETCLECGCYLPIKARGRAMQCPLSRWAVLSEVAEPEAAVSETAEPGESQTPA